MREYQTRTENQNQPSSSRSAVRDHTNEIDSRPMNPPDQMAASIPSGSTREHASLLKRMTRSGSAQSRSSILQLQRSHGNRYVQRLLELARQGDGDGDVTPEVESAIEGARGGGQGLDHGVRRQMESAFGADFSGVRIHTGAEAHSLNRAVSAIAFTTGQDIFFRDGAYTPETSGGKELLAHELTHVVQQGGTSLTSNMMQSMQIQRICPACEEEKNKLGRIQGKLAVGAPDDQYEQEADQVAKAVTTWVDFGASSASQLSATGVPLAVHRQCECGSHAGSNGMCAECRAKTTETVQRRALGAPPGHLIQRDPFEPAGTDNSSCRDKITEDGARCADHANTMCSVTGAGLGGSAALVGAGIGSLIFPGVGTLIGGAAGLLLGGIGGAKIYGDCVERMNAACRVRTAQGLKRCDQKFPPVTGLLDQGGDQSQQLAQGEQGSAGAIGSSEGASGTEMEESA